MLLVERGVMPTFKIHGQVNYIQSFIIAIKSVLPDTLDFNVILNANKMHAG